MFLTFSIHHDGELRENPASGYGSVSAMISKDVLMLIQLNCPGIELCQILNMKGATNSSGSVPHMEKFCTLLLPPLQDGACTVWATCAGEHPGHEEFSHGPLPEYPPASPRPSRCFRISMRDSVISVVLKIQGRDWGIERRCYGGSGTPRHLARAYLCCRSIRSRSCCAVGRVGSADDECGGSPGHRVEGLPRRA